MSEHGFYYLHENGDLVWRRFEPEQGPGGFVRKVWPVSPYRETAWRIAVEALALGARKSRIWELKEKWGLTDEDALEFCRRYRIELHKKEGPPLACFEVVHSPSGRVFCGVTALEALADYVKGGGSL